jgi:signal transduction histidine kinase/DNA-binding response OmpR family regulator/predicted RNA-binding protein with RPS1 domain
MTEILRGKAIKVLASGIIVKLTDDREGFLPRREFTLFTTRDLRQVIQIGREFEVVADNKDDALGERVLLQLASGDNWERLQAECPPGATVTGVVSGIEPYGVFVDLLPGVTGLVQREELADVHIGRVENNVWLGDVVRCNVLSINLPLRRVALSIRAAASTRNQSLQTNLSAEFITPLSLTEQRDSIAPATTQTKAPSLRILIVDNEAELREQLAEHLQHSDHVVSKAATVSEASALLETQAFDIIVLDIGLPGTTGLEMTGQLLKTSTRPQIILMTDWGTAIRLDAEIDHFRRQGVGLITKPRCEPELDHLIAAYYAKVSGTREERLHNRVYTSTEYLSDADLKRHLLRILNRLRKRTGAAELVVFAINGRTQRLDILAYHSNKHGLPEKELQTHWIYSPIRDALQDGDTVLAENARDGKEAGRFRYLSRIFDFAACIGVPIPAETPAALFIFHPKPASFTRLHQDFVRAAAEQIGGMLDRHLKEQALIEMYRYVLLGQLGAVVVHEINNKLGSVNWNIQKLPDTLRAIEASHDPEDARRLWSKAHERSQTLAEAMKDLLKLTGSFDALVRRQEATRLNVHEIIKQTIAFSSPLAEEAHVTLQMQFNHPAPYVIGIAVWLQQAILNTLFNAIQQIRECEVHRGENVLITTSAGQHSTGRDLQIRIYDDGPGIHTSLRERIFDLGFTTRQGGSGIGLFITRQLIESLGGRISVEESHVLWGTTMLIELPTLEINRGSGDETRD